MRERRGEGGVREVTARNVGKVTRFREGGEEALEREVRRVERELVDEDGGERERRESVEQVNGMGVRGYKAHKGGSRSHKKGRERGWLGLRLGGVRGAEAGKGSGESRVGR